MNRLASCVRRNSDFAVMQDIAAEHGLDLAVESGGRTGHPRAVFRRGERSAWVPLSSSPGGRINLSTVRTRALRRLRHLGIVEAAK